MGIIGALLMSPACHIETPDDDNGNGGSTAEGGKGGSSGSRAGSAGKAASGGKKNMSGGDAGESGQGGAGGEGGAAACPGCASGFCLEDGTCVDCLPSNDQCPSGQYCTNHNECAPGCKNDTTSCASGVCGADHNCQRCISDSECTAEYVCSAGVCANRCSAEQEGKSLGCSSGLICCSQRCSNLAIDSRNCGSCGHACGSSQFCGLTACANTGAGGSGAGGGAGSGAGGAAGAGSGSCVECRDTTLANLCSVGKVTVILDTNKNASDGNRVPGRAMGAALRDKCVPKPLLTEAEQDSVEALNLTTGRPVSNSSELLVVAGGPFFQNVEGYLEEQDIAPLYLKVSGDVTEFRRSSTNKVVVSLPVAGDHDSHDIFIIQFMRDSASGSLVLNEQGFWLSGTVAGAYQVINGLLPQLAQQTKAWYAYEWTDKNGDKAPDQNEILLLDSGN